MHGIWETMNQGDSHGFAGGVAALWIFSAAVSAMSVPTAESSPAYQWLFRFAHLLAANLDRAGILEGGSAEAISKSTAK